MFPILPVPLCSVTRSREDGSVTKVSEAISVRIVMQHCEGRVIGIPVRTVREQKFSIEASKYSC